MITDKLTGFRRTAQLRDWVASSSTRFCDAPAPDDGATFQYDAYLQTPD